MKVSEFCFRYSKLENEEEQKKFVIEHIKKDYVPYEVKVAHCQMIAEHTMFEDGTVKLNTPARYMLLICVFIQDHMDIEWKDIDNVAAFNQLESTGADDLICGILNGEFQRYRAVLDMIVDDTMDRERNYVDFVNTLFDKFGTDVDKLSTAIAKANDNG